MRPKLYALDLSCPACGEDDRYCEACVGAILHAQARLMERPSDSPGVLRLAWRAVFGFTPPPLETLFLPSTTVTASTSFPARCLGAVAIIDGGPSARQSVVCAEEFANRGEQCQKTKAPTCERRMCDEHCALICRVECPNRIQMKLRGTG